jgi:general stress protein YciG
MMVKGVKRPRDTNQLAKLMVDILAGQVEDREPTPEERGVDPAASALGKKGGPARAASMTPERRAEIAKKGSKEPDSGHQWVFTAVKCGLRTFGTPFVDHPNEISAAITALATIFIALYTSALSASTSALRDAAEQQKLDMLESLRIARDAANAAKKSADVAEKSLLVANRPIITISPLQLCPPDRGQVRPHILFGLRNSGNGVAVVNKVCATIQTTPSGGNVLTLANKAKYIAPNVGFAIEVRQRTSGHRIASPVLGVPELEKINRGEIILEIIFNIMSKDIFENPYAQIFPFQFDPTQGIFTHSSRLIPEN